MTYLAKGVQANDKRQILFLLFAVLSLYAFAVFAPINLIDDAGILKFYREPRLGPLEVVRPGSGYYYRPLISLSFYLDHLLLAQNSYLLHLENILIHAANTVLLFLLAKRMFTPTSRWLHLVTALLFASHPVNAEAVSWIAGRTDPLALLFVLLSSLALLKGVESMRGGYTLLSVLFLAAGVMAKETALLFVPGSLLLVRGWLQTRREDPESTRWARRQSRVLIFSYCGICLGFVLLLFARGSGDGNSLSKLLAGDGVRLNEAVPLAVSILGFYLKKLVLPWPLNFGIISVSRWYAVPALISLSALFFLPRKNPYFFMVLIGLLFLVPALVVGVFDVAWTVVAERYLYLPCAFFCLGCTGYLSLLAARVRRPRLLAVTVSLVVATAAFSTLQRTRVWQSNQALYRDTVAKSPDFAMLHNTLAVTLIQAGRIPEAQQELNLASSLEPSALLRGLIRRNMFLIALTGMSRQESRRFFNLYGLEKSREDTEILAAWKMTDDGLFKTLPAGEERDAVVAELIEVNQALYARTLDPFLLYHNGQLSLERGDRKGAAACFAKSYLKAPEGSHYRAAAKKLAEKLGGGAI